MEAAPDNHPVTEAGSKEVGVVPMGWAGPGAVKGAGKGVRGGEQRG